MYNRYIPQNDGSFRRRMMPEQHNQLPPEQPPAPKPEPQAQSLPPRPTHNSSAGSFFRHLLPKDFDTGDLIIVLLLLLMAGDSEEEKNTALLTLALYFFM